MSVSDTIASLRVVATYGGAAALLLVGVGSFLVRQPTAGWACAAAAAGILFREALHVFESKADQ